MLPDSVLVSIINLLSLQDILNLSTTNRSLFLVCSSDAVWRHQHQTYRWVCAHHIQYLSHLSSHSISLSFSLSLSFSAVCTLIFSRTASRQYLVSLQVCVGPLGAFMAAAAVARPRALLPVPVVSRVSAVARHSRPDRRHVAHAVHEPQGLSRHARGRRTVAVHARVLAVADAARRLARATAHHAIAQPCDLARRSRVLAQASPTSMSCTPNRELSPVNQSITHLMMMMTPGVDHRHRSGRALEDLSRAIVRQLRVLQAS